MKTQTLAVHAGQQPDPSTGALNTPVYLTSTYSYGTADEGKARFAGQNPGYIYSRFANPTNQALELKLAALEGADEAIVLASGMAAISAIVYALCEQGDIVAFIDPVYGGTDAFLRNTLVRAGITVQSFGSAEDFAANHTPNTRLVLWEPLTNPTLKVVNSQLVIDTAKQIGAISVCDNTFLTPALLKPLALGADLVMHSGTKYLCGHGDLIAGVVAGNGPLIQRVRTVALKHLGASMGPQEAYLLQRGVKTLPLRMQAHCHNAQQVAEFLQNQPQVARVYHPGLTQHAGHDIIKQSASGFGGMVALELHGGFDACARFLDALTLFAQAVSLGDLESLACHPATTTHAAMTAADRTRAAVSDNLVRLSVGIEDIDDLLADLAQALQKI